MLEKIRSHLQTTERSEMKPTPTFKSQKSFSEQETNAIGFMDEIKQAEKTKMGLRTRAL